jgi:hypothetical protein
MELWKKGFEIVEKGCYHSVISQAEEEVDRGNHKTTLESRIYPS